MPTPINRSTVTPTPVPPAPVGAATPVAPVAPVTPVAPVAPVAPTATDTVVGNPNASGAASVVQALKLDGGYGANIRNHADSYSVAGQNAGTMYNGVGNTAGATVSGKGYERGAISVATTPIDDKTFAVEVKTMHSGASLKGNDDGITLFLETKVQGKDKNGNPAEVIIRLATPHTGPANNVDAHNGSHRFVISYKDLDAALKAHHPDLRLFDAKKHFTGAGATIAVRARWDAGHDWGGYGRLGVTEIPAPAKRANAAAVQAGNVASSSVKIAASDMPVDFEHTMPAAVQNKYAAIFNTSKPMTVSTRLERELKGKVSDVAQHEAAIVRMQLIAAGYEPLIKELRTALTTELMAKAKMKRPAAKAFAEKLHVSPHTEWATKDANGAFIDSSRFADYKKDASKLVATGLAKTNGEAEDMLAFINSAGVVFHDPLPLEDKYKGTKSEMQKSVIRRVRSNAIAEGVYNVKPGPGMLQSDVDAETAGQPCGLIRARIEASVELKDKNVSRDEIAKYEQGDGSPYNIIGQLLEDAGVYVAGNYTRFQEAFGIDKTPVEFVMMQERHRFDIEVDGMKLDTSIDFVNVDDNGTKVTRQIVEMELEHKFIEATPKAPAAPATTPAVGDPTATPAPATTVAAPKLQNNFSDLTTQQSATAALTDVSLNVPPRFHRLADLDDKELWQTQEQLVSNAVTNALVGLLYPQGVSSCEQKGVEMARAMGKLD